MLSFHVEVAVLFSCLSSVCLSLSLSSPPPSTHCERPLDSRIKSSVMPFSV